MKRAIKIGDIKTMLAGMPDDGELSLSVSLSQKHRKGIYPCRISSARRVLDASLAPLGIMVSLQIVEPQGETDAA